MAQQAETKTIRDYFQPTGPTTQPGIMQASLEVNNVELNPGLIQLTRDCAIRGSPAEDPHRHILSFLEICNTIKINGVTFDAIRLRLFLFSVQDKAKDWLESLTPGSITTWDGLAHTFFFLKNSHQKR